MYLTKTRLINCQGCRDLTFEFAPGLNVIKADDNSVGKSIFYKVLREAATPGYWGQFGRQQLIRFGCDFASAEYYFSDGYKCTFTLWKNKRNYCSEFKNEPTVDTNEPPVEWLQRMSIIASDLYIANVLTTQSDLLFVESSSKTDRALLTLLTNNQDMEALILNATLANKELIAKLESLRGVSSYLSRELDSIAVRSTDEYISRINLIKSVTPCLSVLDSFVSLADTFIDKINLGEVTNDIHMLLCILKFLSTFGNLDLPNKYLEDTISKMLNTLYLIKSVKALDIITSTSEIQGKCNSELLYTAQRLQYLVDLAESYCSLKDKVEEDNVYLAKIKETINNSGSVAVCPFYKEEVIYRDTGCVPLNN